MSHLIVVNGEGPFLWGCRTEKCPIIDEQVVKSCRVRRPLIVEGLLLQEVGRGRSVLFKSSGSLISSVHFTLPSTLCYVIIPPFLLDFYTGVLHSPRKVRTLRFSCDVRSKSRSQCFD